MKSDIDICSTALVMLGADEIESFQDESREAKLCNMLYESTLRSCLSDRCWTFARGQIQLNKLEDKPLYGYKNAFQMPIDFLRLYGKQNNALPHILYENKLYCDAEVVQVSYIYRCKEDRFSPKFLDFLIHTLCEKLAVSLLEDEKKSKYYQDKALDSRRRAGLEDSQNSYAKSFDLHNFAILAVRGSGVMLNGYYHY